MQVGFIGLGNLGSAIVTRLHEQGVSIQVWNRSMQKAEKLALPKANSIEALVENADVIFLCLFDSPAVEAILTAGLEACNLEGKTVIDLSTNHPKHIDAIANRVKQAKGAYLECPVFGSVAPALKGEVTVVCSGEQEVFETHKPLLESFAKSIFFLEGYGQASKMKLINNLCLGSFMATLAECTHLGEKCGINKGDVLDILGAGGGQSLVLNAKKAKLLNEDFSPHFSNAAINKDLHCLQDLAYSLNEPLYTASVVKELFSKMKNLGKGEEDFSSVYQLFKQ